MEPHQRQHIAALLADDEGNMLAQVVAAAEGDDLGLLAWGHRQAGAGGDGEVRGVAPVGQIGARQADRLFRRGGVDKESRKNARQPCQLHRGAGLGHVSDGLGHERPLQRPDQIQRRVGQSAGGGQIEGFGRADQHG